MSLAMKVPWPNVSVMVDALGLTKSASSVMLLISPLFSLKTGKSLLSPVSRIATRTGAVTRHSRRFRSTCSLIFPRLLSHFLGTIALWNNASDSGCHGVLGNPLCEEGLGFLLT